MSRALAIVLLALAAPASGGDFDALYQLEAVKHGLDWRLIKALAIVESNENPRAENRRDPSIGLMQLHCTEDAQGRCTNRLNVEGWTGITREQLLDPRTNVRFGTAILAWNIRHFGVHRGVACYNAWSVCRDGQAEPFTNQAYVEKVLSAYRKIQTTPAGGGANNTGSTGRKGSRPYSSTLTVPAGPRKGL